MKDSVRIADIEFSSQVLPDGRVLIRRANGFTYFIVSKKGIESEVDEKYYYTVLKNNRLTKNKRRERMEARNV